MEWTASSVRGGLRLVFDSIGAVTGTVERMHETIVRAPLPWEQDPRLPERSHGRIASTVYGSIRRVNEWLREGVDFAIDFASPSSADSSASTAAGHVTFAAVANGILGDHLEETGNPLAISMHFRSADGPLKMSSADVARAFPQASPHVVVLVHGLCMSERAWSRNGTHAFRDAFESGLGYSAVYLRYNSGRRISINGRELALRLDDLVREWPVEVESLTFVGHSMGGLVARSACAYAERDGRAWRSRLRSMVCLGAPHHGAPLERIGRLVHLAMEFSPYVRPLAFGRLRSSGIRDLRHGNLLDEDWEREDDRGPWSEDERRTVPLSENVAHYFAAGSVAVAGLAGGSIGDLLVPVSSALGHHCDAARHLALPATRQRVFDETDHLALLDGDHVVRQVMEWLGPPPEAD